MTRTNTLQLFAAVLVLSLFVANVIATHDMLTEPHPGHNDFLTVWEAARSFFREGLDPYGEQATINIQTGIYGRPAVGDEFPNYFAYPFYTVFLMWPLVYSSYAWASAIWMVLLESCLVGALILLLDLYRWRPPPWLMAVLLLGTLIIYYPARGLLLGQVSHTVYLAQVLTLWLLMRRQEALAGVLLAVSTIKPQMGFLLIPFLLLWGVRTWRIRFVIMFVLAWSAMIVASFAAQPDWISGWLRQLRDYPSYTDIGAPVWIVMEHALGLGTVGEWIANLFLWMLMLWAWTLVVLHDRQERLEWTIMLTLTITHLSALRTATPHYIIFMIPAVFYFRHVSTRYRSGNMGVALIVLGVVVFSWMHFLLTVDGDYEHASVYLPVPFGMLVLLWLTRHWWWDASPVINRADVE